MPGRGRPDAAPRLRAVAGSLPPPTLLAAVHVCATSLPALRPPRSSAPLRAPPAAAAQSPPRALAPPSREPVPGVTDHLTATCALRHVGAGGRRGAGVLKVGKGQGGAEMGRKGDSEAGQAAASRWRLHFARKFVTLKVSSQASGLATAPFSAPVHLLERKTLFARWNESFG